MSETNRSTPNPSASPGSDSSNGGSGHTHVAAIAGGVVGGVVGLLVLVGAALWFVRRRKTRKPASLLDMTGTRTEPTPFEGPSETVVSPQSTQSPAAYLPEKRRREMEQRESAPLLNTAPSSTTSSGTTSVPPGPSTSSSTSYQSRQDELVGLRTEIEDLRRIMLGVHMERPEGSEAPPEYS